MSTADKTAAPAEKSTKPIKVMAVRRGYYGSLREPGDQFEVANKADLGRWMEVIAPAKAPPKSDEKPIA